MKRTNEFVVFPFNVILGVIRPGEMRLAKSEAGAVRLAELLADHCDGAAAFEVIVEHETGEMTSPRLLAEYGQLPDMEELLAEAA
jgi:hypothetical protein